jgi:hypothetical protein
MPGLCGTAAKVTGTLKVSQCNSLLISWRRSYARWGMTTNANATAGSPRTPCGVSWPGGEPVTFFDVLRTLWTLWSIWAFLSSHAFIFLALAGLALWAASARAHEWWTHQ